MCGIAGQIDLLGRGRVEAPFLEAMTESLRHRGPDSGGYWVEPNLGLGVRRLKIIDPELGDQPIRNEDGSVVVVCNGEILNYRPLTAELRERGHRFTTAGDVEVLVHLYEELGVDLLDRLDGQFAFALYDRRRERLLIARDHFGVSPLFFTVTDGMLLFASEIKALLQDPRCERRLDLAGVDQVLSLPGVVSPRTLFEGVESLPPGHCLKIEKGTVDRRVFWDLDYPLAGEEEEPARTEVEWVDDLEERLVASVEKRLQADVPVGIFLSGGVDSSLVAALATRLAPSVERHSFSIVFADAEIDESPFQRLVASASGFIHHEIPMGQAEIFERLRTMVAAAECPVKETFDACSLALAEAAREAGVPVVLAGEGADELFGGYPGYRFDAAGARANGGELDVDTVLEEELRELLWGDRDLFYEKEQLPLRELKTALYSSAARQRFHEFEYLRFPLVDPERLRGRHPLHQRSYLDFKLRLADHLLTEHGDHMVLAHAVEARYPFLDLGVVELAQRMPPSLKVRGLTEKYVVKKVAERSVPRRIVEREKFGFRAPGTPLLLAQGGDWVHDHLSFERTRSLGVFDPEVVERLKQRYSQPGFRLHPHLETDLLMVVLTLSLFCDLFDVAGVEGARPAA